VEVAEFHLREGAEDAGDPGGYPGIPDGRTAAHMLSGMGAAFLYRVGSDFPVETILVHYADQEVDLVVDRIGAFEKPVEVLHIRACDMAGYLDGEKVLTVCFEAAYRRHRFKWM